MCIPSSFPKLNGFEHRVYFVIYKMREYFQNGPWLDGELFTVSAAVGHGFHKEQFDLQK